MDYKNKRCAVMLKSAIIFQRKLTAGMFIEAVIQEWRPDGLVVEGDVFIPWSNIAAVCPLEALHA